METRNRQEELIAAAKLLKEHCASFAELGTCKGCVFLQGNCYCRLNEEAPSCWEMPQPRRWTDADKRLAEAYLEFGIAYVERISNHGIRAYAADGRACGAPKGAFEALKVGEQLSPYDIIAEE